jgi:hypothetical protein
MPGGIRRNQGAHQGAHQGARDSIITLCRNPLCRNPCHTSKCGFRLALSSISHKPGASSKDGFIPETNVGADFQQIKRSCENVLMIPSWEPQKTNHEYEYPCRQEKPQLTISTAIIFHLHKSRMCRRLNSNRYSLTAIEIHSLEVRK